MKKKLIIYMSKLSIGGMEKALTDFINLSNIRKNYSVDLFLVYNGESNYLSLIPKDVRIIVLYKGKWNIFAKIISGIKFVFLFLKKSINRNQYDCSLCYTHHHGILSKLARLDSENSICFIHADLISSRTTQEINRLKKHMKFDKFKKIICVSNKSKQSFQSVYPNYKGTISVANNYIDYKLITKLSKEKTTDLPKCKEFMFLIVARLEEESKRISRAIEASRKLKEDNYEFKLIIIGDGKNYEDYKLMIKEGNLQDTIYLLGAKTNPYPYFKQSDAFIMCSDYEGYGITLNEARVLNIPIITTDVADAKYLVNDGYGILCKTNDTNGVYNAMKDFLDKEYKVKKRFDPEKFNLKITNEIDKVIEQ